MECSDTITIKYYPKKSDNPKLARKGKICGAFHEFKVWSIFCLNHYTALFDIMLYLVLLWWRPPARYIQISKWKSFTEKRSWDKMAAISRHFRRIFLHENLWISITISLKSVTEGLINNFPDWCQVIIWTNDDLIHWCTYESAGLNELKFKLDGKSILYNSVPAHQFVITLATCQCSTAVV